MTRTIFLFEDGTALVDGIKADAAGDASALPFISEAARLSAAKAAIALDDWEAAESASARGVVSSSDDKTVTVLFVAPPVWDNFGTSLWVNHAGAPHAVFHSTTMLVDDVAVPGCVGLPFKNEAARRDCAAWCLRNDLDDIAVRVSRTPVGGNGPYCTWPDAELGDVELVDRSLPQRARQHGEAEDYEWVDLPNDAEEVTQSERTALERSASNVVELFGCTVGLLSWLPTK